MLELDRTHRTPIQISYNGEVIGKIARDNQRKFRVRIKNVMWGGRRQQYTDTAPNGQSTIAYNFLAETVRDVKRAFRFVEQREVIFEELIKAIESGDRSYFFPTSSPITKHYGGYNKIVSGIVPAVILDVAWMNIIVPDDITIYCIRQKRLPEHALIALSPKARKLHKIMWEL